MTLLRGLHRAHGIAPLLLTALLTLIFASPAAGADSSNRLQFSEDGLNFTTKPPQDLFNHDQPTLVPGGAGATDGFHVRNASTDPARLTLRSALQIVNLSGTVREAKAVEVDIRVVPPGQLPDSGEPSTGRETTVVLGPGEEKFVRITVRLPWDTGNGPAEERSMAEDLVIEPSLSVGLEQVMDDDDGGGAGDGGPGNGDDDRGGGPGSGGENENDLGSDNSSAANNNGSLSDTGLDWFVRFAATTGLAATLIGTLILVVARRQSRPRSGSTREVTPYKG